MKKNKKKHQKKGRGFDWSLVLQELLSFKMVFILLVIGIQIYIFFFEMPTMTNKELVFELLDTANYMSLALNIIFIVLFVLLMKGLFEGFINEVLSFMVPMVMLIIVMVLFGVGLEYNHYQELKKQYDSTETVKIQGDENKEK